MRTTMQCGRRLFLGVLWTFVTCLVMSDGKPSQAGETVSSDGPMLKMAQRVISQSGLSGGICLLAGKPRVDLAIAIARQGPFTVRCLCLERQECDRLRKAIRAKHLYGTVSADTFLPGHLPVTDNLINLLIVEPFDALAAAGMTTEELQRVVAPLGTVYIGIPSDDRGDHAWQQQLKQPTGNSQWVEDPSSPAAGRWLHWTKPWPAAIDSWTHYLHGADGNPVAQDHVVGPPKHYQWVSGPNWLQSHETDSSISTMVTSGGRLFYIMNEVPASLAGPKSPPDRWYLEAKDAFNGVSLWKVPIRRWGWREWKNSWFTHRPGDFPLNIRKRLVAIGDYLYVTLGYRAPVSQLDARTGRILQTYDGTEGAGELLVHGQTLVVAVVQDGLARVMGIATATGETLWTTKSAYRGTTVDYIRWNRSPPGFRRPELDPALNIATDGKRIALIDGPDLVGIDFATGDALWRTRFPSTKQDGNAGGIHAKDSLWNGTMIISHGVVIHASPTRLAAFSSETGKQLWAQPKSYIGHLWYEWKDVFVVGDLVWTWGADLERGFIQLNRHEKQREAWPRTADGYDIRTGTLQKQVELGPTVKANHHHRCYRNKATVRYILASRRGSEFVDLAGGPHSINNWVRGTCHVGMMPANGLQYVPPHPCACYREETINGMNVLASAIHSDASAKPEETLVAKTSRVERGPAFGWQPDPQGSESGSTGSTGSMRESWPTFRHDAARTGATDTRLPDKMARLWRCSIGRRLSAPIVAAGRLFASAIDQHHLFSIDVQDGTIAWSFPAGARIDSPPTYDHGFIFFGSADGYVYCVRAHDGVLAWRFRAAPASRMIGADGQLESAWPVSGSVLIDEGKVYCVAGRTSHLDGGLYLYALDTATGAIVHQQHLQGPEFNSSDISENYKLPTGTLPDILASDGRKIYMRTRAFDMELNRRAGKPELQTAAGFLDASYFKRMPWKYQGDYGRMLVHDKRSVYYVRMFDSLRGLDPSVYFTPGRKGYLLFTKSRDWKKAGWRIRVPVRIQAMLIAGNRLAISGMPDVVDPKDPWGAFEGRRGGRLLVLNRSTGETVWQYDLASPPVFNGIAAAEGRLYVTEQDGSIACFGGP